MKAVKLSLVIVAAALLTIGLGEMAYAFHDGGVANCEGCHTMHNSIGNTAVLSKGNAKQFNGVNYLLKGSDQSSTCLNCHSGSTLSSYHVFTTGSIANVGPANYTPGGDFAWLTKNWTPISHGSTLPGQRLGHNVIAADFSLVQDPDLSVAPGGTVDYKSSYLSCISCHDPHPSERIIDSSGTMAKRVLGQASLPIYGSGSYGDAPTATEAVGVYRLLGGNGYQPVSVQTAGGPVFSAEPPVAVAPKAYNRKETTTDTRVAYGKGMSEWCANCHTAIHNDSLSNAFIHPASNAAVLKGNIIDTATIYNAYVKSGDLSGKQVSSYTSLIPYEEGTAVIATLAGHADTTGTQKGGPSTGTENVMCLSCHRAHASGFRYISRWDNDTEFITEAGAYNAATGNGTLRNTVEYTAAMYDRPASNYATYQRSLCNKCHAKD